MTSHICPWPQCDMSDNPVESRQEALQRFSLCNKLINMALRNCAGAATELGCARAVCVAERLCGDLNAGVRLGLVSRGTLGSNVVFRGCEVFDILSARAGSASEVKPASPA